MNSKTLSTIDAGPSQPALVEHGLPGSHRFVIGLEEPLLDLVRRISELFSPYVPHQGILALAKDIHQAACAISMATAIQLVASIHQRQVSDHIVLDLICAELSQAFQTVGAWDRSFLMGMASDLQHCGEMAVSEVLTRHVPLIDNRQYCTVIGYRAHPGYVPYFTVDISITGPNSL